MAWVPRRRTSQPEWIRFLKRGTGPSRGLEVISNASSSCMVTLGETLYVFYSRTRDNTCQLLRVVVKIKCDQVVPGTKELLQSPQFPFPEPLPSTLI